MRRRSEIVPRPWATGAPAKRPVSGQRINCLGDLDWPRWEGPEQGSRNCVGGAAERQLRRPQGRQRARQSPPASLPFARRKGKSLGFRKNRSLEPMTLAQNLLLFNASDDLRLAFGSHEHLPISKSEVQNVQALGMGSEPRESADLV